MKNRKMLHTADNGPYRYLIFARSTGKVYYVNKVGTPVVQFDVKTRTKKVIAFLHPFYEKKYGYV